MTDLTKDFEYYTSHQQELVNSYGGKFIVIKDQQIVEVSDTQEDAYRKAREKFALGTFLIQRVEPGEGSYTQTFHSRVV